MHFYPRPPRGGRPAGARGYAACGRISIHALREEGDTVQNVPGDKLSAISIHALREEGDAETKHLQELSGAFLSTPSARRATQNGQHRGQPARNFYPRPPRGGRLAAAVASLRMVTVFLSTPSARRATRGPGTPHRPLGYFYPRPPRGGRHAVDLIAAAGHGFLSTPSARRATPSDFYPYVRLYISIHALREEGDHCARQILHRRQSISIHALREEGDAASDTAEVEILEFLSTPSARRATSRPITSVSPMPYFYPRPPRGGRPRRSGSAA